MARKPVSDRGLYARVMDVVVKTVFEKGGSKEDILKLLGKAEINRVFLEKIAEVILAEKHQGVKIENIYPVPVDCGLSLPDMIKLGNYHNVSENIKSDNYPIISKGKRVFRMRLVGWERGMSPKDIPIRIANMGLRPAMIEHFLAFGATYPLVQFQRNVVCVGHISAQHPKQQDVPVLNSNAVMRFLELKWYWSVFKDSYYFLAYEP